MGNLDAGPYWGNQGIDPDFPPFGGIYSGDCIADRTRGEVRELRAEVKRLQEENQRLKDQLERGGVLDQSDDGRGHPPSAGLGRINQGSGFP